MTRYIPGCISSTKQISLSSRHGLVAVLVYRFIFLPVLEYTSVKAESATECSSVFEAKHHCHGKMWWVLATYLPTPWTRSLCGLISSTASRHSAKSLSVGSSRGHLIVEWFTPCVQCWSTVGQLLDANRMSDRRMICRSRRTLLNPLIVSLLCPRSMNTNMRNLSPCCGNRND